MRHNREEVIERTIREFKLLDRLVANLSDQDWERLVPRPETKDPWTVKDALAHITHFKADIIRSINRQHKPSDVRGLNITDENHVIYTRWRDRSPREVLEWHRQVQKDLLATLKDMPDEWFTGKERKADWPFDLDGHSEYHRVKDIEEALATTARKTARKSSKNG